MRSHSTVGPWDLWDLSVKVQLSFASMEYHNRQFTTILSTMTHPQPSSQTTISYQTSFCQHRHLGLQSDNTRNIIISLLSVRSPQHQAQAVRKASTHISTRTTRCSRHYRHTNPIHHLSNILRHRLKGACLLLSLFRRCLLVLLQSLNR